MSRAKLLGVGGSLHDPTVREFRQPLRWVRIAIEAVLTVLVLALVFVIVAWNLMVAG